MPELDVLEYLATKGLRGRPARGDEYSFPCFFDCNEAPDSRKRKLYVNVAEGFYHCKVCEAFGGTYLLQKHFGDEPDVGRTLKGHNLQARRDVLNKATSLAQGMLMNNDEILLYLIGRGLEPETIERFKLGCVTPGWSLVGGLDGFSLDDILSSGLARKEGERRGQDYFWNHILIPYLSHGQTTTIRGRWHDDSEPVGGKYLSGPDEDVRLFNVDDLNDAEEVILVEGEFDTMILRQEMDKADERHRGIAIVGIGGSQSLPANFEDLLGHAKRIYTGFDPDKAGKKAAEVVKQRLGNRVRNLSFPVEFLVQAYNDGRQDKNIDWSLLIHEYGLTWQHVVAMLGNAKGKRVFTMAECQLTSKMQKLGRPEYKTGISQIDAAIGGLRAGQLVIVLAKTGTGKTMLLCNLAYYMRRFNILFVSMEQTREEIYDRLEKIYRFHNVHATDEAIVESLSKIQIADENRLNEGGLNELVDEFELESGVRPEIVFVDYLGYYARGQKGGTQYEKVTNGAMQLKAEAKGGGDPDPRKRFLVIAPAQVNRGAKEGKPIDLDDARDSGAIEETADHLWSLWRPDEALAPMDANGSRVYSGKMRLEILKSRSGGKGRSAGLQADMLTQVIVEDGSPESKRAAENVHRDTALHWNYEKLRRHELQPVQREFPSMQGKGRYDYD